jgi:prepilin-type N-terminal cleavage/methylation domain-containing protein
MELALWQHSPTQGRYIVLVVDNKPYSNMKGFTLLELLVVLALIGASRVFGTQSPEELLPPTKYM